ncbi:MAG: hypothetical protein ACSHWU_01975 [Marinicella sp.]
MKKIITTVSAMTLSLPSGATDGADLTVEPLTRDDLESMSVEEATFKGSGFVDLDVQKTVLLSYDADGSGDISLGDELKYTIQVTNLNQTEATDIVLFDFLDSRIDLNLGTVAITQGFVVSGNGFFDPSNQVYVDFGTIAPNWFALVDFDVTITNLNPGINVIENSAEVFGPSGSFFISDDPTTPEFDSTKVTTFGPLPDLIFENGFEFRGSGGF